MEINKFDSRKDVQQFIHTHMDRMDLSCYSMDQDKLLDHATENFLDIMKEIPFKYGNALPSDWFKHLFHDDQEFWAIFE